MKSGQRRINRANHGLSLSGTIAQPLTLVEQCRFSIEPWIVERPPDLFQRETEFAPEQDLLQAQQVGIGVQAIARGCSGAGHEQPDGVLMMQRADGHTRHPGDVPDLIRTRASHDISVRPDAA